MTKLQSAILLVLVGAVMILLPASGANAQWIENGTALCTETNNQLDPEIVSDGAGGAIITWYDNRTGTDWNIRAQRVGATGVPHWTPDGVGVCTASLWQDAPVIASDADGGAIIAWRDSRAINYDVYAQRVGADGAILWTTSGVAICTASGDQDHIRIIADGAGGAIITWQDYRSGNWDIYAQRVDASGVVQWTANGLALCTYTEDQEHPEIGPDSMGGAIIAWDDNRSVSDTDIYAQRVDASGFIQWTVNGVAVCTETDGQSWPTIVTDPLGYAIVAWDDFRSGTNHDIYAQRVDANSLVQWTTNGVALCTAPETQYASRITTDGNGGAIVVWEDYRSGSGHGDIYAQRVDASGDVQWTADGVPLCTALESQVIPRIVSDDAGGAIVTWTDFRGSASHNIFVQRVDDSGVIRWTENGVPLCTASGNQSVPRIAPDLFGGAIVAWQSQDTTGVTDIYAQRVTRQGHWGYPAPTITLTQDVPGDQGGYTRINFDASRLDSWPDLAISYYSIWRTLSPLNALAAKSHGISLTSPGKATAALVGKAYYSSSNQDWELIGTIEARLWPGYGYTIATLRDSTSADPGWEYYWVLAHSEEYFDFWGSAPDSGYSVDNLSPGAPAALAGEYIGGSNVLLHWNPNTEADLSHYAVYRGVAPDFVPDETNMLGTATDTMFVDTGFGYGEEYYYKVSAVDVHENESPFSVLTPDKIAGTPGVIRDYDNVLFQNTPNPLQSSTRIAFSMKEAGHVRLRIFDAKGRLVRVLADEIRQANQYVESWNGRDRDGRTVPAGTYFYTLEAPGWKASKKMTVAR